MEKLAKNAPIVFLAILALGVAVIWYAVFYFETRQYLRVTFFDVGQGDATFIETPGGNQILIDGGPDSRILAKLGDVLPFWDRSLDLVIVTHPHADHLAGLIEVVKRYDVDRVMESGVGHGTPEYAAWQALLKERDIPVVLARRGQRMDAGNSIMLDVLSPAEDAVASADKPHDANIVAVLTHGETTVLFTGDAEKILEYRLLFESPAMLDADVLKVGHHGSKTSSTEVFLKAVSPDSAVISAGKKNRYGHPHPDIIERLRQLNIPLRRTDTDGDIRLESDGISYRLIAR